jgi:hypothetical protein
MRIRILLLIKVMEICNHWSIDPQRLCFETLKLLNFLFNTDPDPDFTLMRILIQLPKIMRIDEDPDPQPCSVLYGKELIRWRI